jgi:hypothetical protein
MMASKIVPIGGEHRSPQSLLAQLQSDDTIRGVAVVYFHGKNDVGYAYHEVNAEELTLAGAILTQQGLRESEP